MDISFLSKRAGVEWRGIKKAGMELNDRAIRKAGWAENRWRRDRAESRRGTGNKKAAPEGRPVGKGKV